MRKLVVAILFLLWALAAISKEPPSPEACSNDKSGAPGACSIPVADSGAFAGLKMDDVVVSVDGKVLPKPLDAKTFSRELASKKANRIQVLREGRKQLLVRPPQ